MDNLRSTSVRESGYLGKSYTGDAERPATCPTAPSRLGELHDRQQKNLERLARLTIKAKDIRNALCGSPAEKNTEAGVVPNPNGRVEALFKQAYEFEGVIDILETALISLGEV